jgi:hypothetical protein
MKTAVALLVASAFAVSTAFAADVGMSADIGTTGLGLHLSTELQSNVNVRFGVNGGNYNYSTNTNNVNYDLRMKLMSVEGLVDWFPTAGSTFRVSGGLAYNGSKVNVTAKPTAVSTFTVNGNTYSSTSAGSINGDTNFRKAAPHIGIGFGNALAGQPGTWSFQSDFGVLFPGSPNTTLNNAGCTAFAALCAQLAKDVAAENLSLNDKMSKFKAYPVLRVGVGYKF